MLSSLAQAEKRNRARRAIDEALQELSLEAQCDVLAEMLLAREDAVQIADDEDDEPVRPAAKRLSSRPRNHATPPEDEDEPRQKTDLIIEALAQDEPPNQRELAELVYPGDPRGRDKLRSMLAILVKRNRLRRVGRNEYRPIENRLATRARRSAGVGP